MQPENPYRPPASAAQPEQPRPTVMGQALVGLWRGFRTGAIAGVIIAILLMAFLAAMFPSHPLEAIGYYNLILMPIFWALFVGIPAGLITSTILALMAAFRRK